MPNSEFKNKIVSFKDMDAWKQSHELVLLIYRLTKTFPPAETFGLISQMRRAAISIPSNIAEGFSRYSSKEKIQFYAIARGSLTELHNQIIISKDTRFLTEADFQTTERQIIRVHKILNRLLSCTPRLSLKK